MDTSFLSEINWLAVAVAALAYFALGAVWYTKIGFGKQWIRASGVNMEGPEAGKGAGGIMMFTLVLEFLICFGIAILANELVLVSGFLSGVKLGLLTGGLLIAPAILIGYLYQSKFKSLGAIDAGYHFMGNIIAAIIICIW